MVNYLSQTLVASIYYFARHTGQIYTANHAVYRQLTERSK